MWTEISTLLSVGLYSIGLCISIRFLLLFLFLSVRCFHGGCWHIYLYRPSVLLFNTIAGLIDFSTAGSAQRGSGCAIWRELELLSLRSIAAGREALNIQRQWWISLWRLAGFISWKWSVRWFLFTGDVSVFYFYFFVWMGDGHTLSFSFWFLLFYFLHWFHYCRAVSSLTRVCTIFFHAHLFFFFFSFDMWY